MTQFPIVLSPQIAGCRHFRNLVTSFLPTFLAVQLCWLFLFPFYFLLYSYIPAIFGTANTLEALFNTSPALILSNDDDTSCFYLYPLALKGSLSKLAGGFCHLVKNNILCFKIYFNVVIINVVIISTMLIPSR